jgi:hypothetical protein
MVIYLKVFKNFFIASAMFFVFGSYFGLEVFNFLLEGYVFLHLLLVEDLLLEGKSVVLNR